MSPLNKGVYYGTLIDLKKNRLVLEASLGSPQAKSTGINKKSDKNQRGDFTDGL